MMTATEASRGFSALLDEAEHGETIVITRGGQRIAEIRPANTGNGNALQEFAREWMPNTAATRKGPARCSRNSTA